MPQCNHVQRARHQLVRRKCPKCQGHQLHVLVLADLEIIHFLQHLELQELLVRQMVDHLVPEIIRMDLQLLDLHFVQGQERLSDLVALVPQELQECAHQWARGLHLNLVTVPHHLHVQAELVVADTHLQQVRPIEVALRHLLVREAQVVRVPVVQVADQVVDVQAVQVAVVPVAKRADQDKDRSQRKLVAKRLIIYAHHHLVALLFRTEMEALQ